MLKKKTIEDHLYNKQEWVIELFKKLHVYLLDLKDTEHNLTQPYVGYKIKIDNKRPRLFVEVHVLNEKIQLHLRQFDYNEHQGIKIWEVPNSHKWTLTKLVDVNQNTDFESLTKLIKQSYKTVA